MTLFDCASLPVALHYRGYNFVMHELAVTESLLEIVIQFAEENQAQVVTDVALSIGALSSIIDDSVQFFQ